MMKQAYRDAVVSRQLKTRLITLDPQHPEPELLAAPARALQRGELVAFPTETVYGLGANALDVEAVQMIFLAKGRPADNPLIVHIADLADLSALVQAIPPAAEILFRAFAPGPLTLVLPRSRRISDAVTAGLDTVAVRIPAHPVARSLIRAAGIPVAAPSANRSGRPSPTRAWHVQADLAGALSYILDGGPSSLGLESTVLDLSFQVPQILRPGSISAGQINQVLRPLGLTCVNTAEDRQAEEPIRSPGLKYRHYAPRAHIWPVDEPDAGRRAALLADQVTRFSRQGLRTGLFCSRQSAIRLVEEPDIQLVELDLQAGAAADSQPDFQRPPQVVPVVYYSDQPDVFAAGAALFQALRLLDLEQVDWIVAEGLSSGRDAQAFTNRLLKAAAGSLSGETGTQAIPDQISRKKLICFACTGNTCRSPMAAALFNQHADGGSWQAVSAGLAALPGQPANPLALQVLQESYAIDLNQHQSRLLTESLVSQAVLTLTMTRQQRDLLRRQFPVYQDRIMTLAELADEPEEDLIDPYGQSAAMYEQTAARLAGLIRRILPKLTGHAEF